MANRHFYMISCIVGTLIPWWFFSRFFAQNGLDFLALARDLFANPASSGFTIDLLISILVFFVWVVDDSRRRSVKYWWVVIPAACFVGLSLALPLYLILRSRRAAE